MNIDKHGLRMRFHRRLSSGIKGVSLLELSVALTILCLGTMSVLSALYSVQIMNAATAEYKLADYAMRQQLEQARYNILEMAAKRDIEDIYDTQVGYGTAESPRNFEVAGLRPLKDGKSVGKMFVIQNENSQWLGDPMDLNMDGKIDSAGWDSGYRVFPVRLSVTWKSLYGRKLSHTISTVIVPKKL